jgi:hypothetical protein
MLEGRADCTVDALGKDRRGMTRSSADDTRTDASGGGVMSGTLQPATYTLIAFIDARANAAVDRSDPSRGQSQGTANANVTLTLGGCGSPTSTCLSCPGAKHARPSESRNAPDQEVTP